MSPLFGVLFLIFMMLFHEIEEASGLLKRIMTKKNSLTNNDEDTRIISIHGTPKRHTSRAAINNSMENRGLENNQEKAGQESVDLFNQHYGSRVHPPTQSGENALDLYKCHQNPNVPDLNNPINIPEGRRWKAKSINLNRKASYDTLEVQAYSEFMQRPFIDGPYSPPGQESVDLFNKHYKHKAHPPPQSEKEALKLYKSHENRNVPDLNNPTNILEDREMRKAKTRRSNLSHKDWHEPDELQAHSSPRTFEDKKEITPEQLKKQYESLELYHKRYGYPDDPSYRKLLESYSGSSRSGSKN